MTLPLIPQGNGECPILFVTISANDLKGSMKFYAGAFGWHTHEVSPVIAGAATPGGPNVALRADSPEGFPAMVPFIGVRDLDATLQDVVAARGEIDRAPWPVPGAGMLARFKDPSGTIYGLASALPLDKVPRIEMPFGTNPKPVANSICSIEMYTRDGASTGPFFERLFGWGSADTMPSYRGFDPGAGIFGVFQSHTPAAPAMTYIYVTDVADTLARVASNGGKRMGNPMSAPGMGTFGYFIDPSGSNMGLIGP